MVATDQSRKCGAASITPPPTKYVSGSVDLAAMENTWPMAIACCLKIDQRHLVAALRVAADLLRRLHDVQTAQFVIGVLVSQ